MRRVGRVLLVESGARLDNSCRYVTWRTATELAVDANGFLTDYIRIHEDMFAPPIWATIRRALPIPFLFQAMRPREREQQLARIRQGLTGIGTETTGPGRTPETKNAEYTLRCVLGEYSIALREAVDNLRRICGGLAEKAEGLPGVSSTDYQWELKHYEESRLKFAAVGKCLTEAYAAFRADSRPA